MQIVGMFAIVASLIFVGFQMRQDQIIARSELGSGTFEAVGTVRQIAISKDFAPIFVKMLENPNDLTVDEAFQVDSFLRMARSIFIRDCYLKTRGIFEECESAIKSHSGLYFGNKYAKSWWRLNALSIQVGPWVLPPWLDVEIANFDDNLSLEILRQVSADM